MIVIFGYQYLFAVPSIIDSEKTRALAALRSDKDALSLSLIPKIELRVGSSGSYKHSYNHGRANDYRISVKNLSPTETLKAVSLEIISILPLDPSYLPMKLHQMHDNIDARRERQDILPGQTVYYDVISSGIQDDGVSYLVINHIVVGVQKIFDPAKVHELKIACYAENSASVRIHLAVQNLNGKSSLSAI